MAVPLQIKHPADTFYDQYLAAIVISYLQYCKRKEILG